jgi:hypothetical protein
MGTVRFQVLTATSMREAVLWGVAPCSLVMDWSLPDSTAWRLGRQPA